MQIRALLSWRAFLFDFARIEVVTSVLTPSENCHDQRHPPHEQRLFSFLGLQMVSRSVLHLFMYYICSSHEDVLNRIMWKDRLTKALIPLGRFYKALLNFFKRLPIFIRLRSDLNWILTVEYQTMANILSDIQINFALIYIIHLCPRIIPFFNRARVFKSLTRFGKLCTGHKKNGSFRGKHSELWSTCWAKLRQFF